MKNLVVALGVFMIAAFLLVGCGDKATTKATTYEVKTDSQGGTQLVPVEGNPYEAGSDKADLWDLIEYGTPDEVYRLQEYGDKKLNGHIEIDIATNLLVWVGADGSRGVPQRP